MGFWQWLFGPSPDGFRQPREQRSTNGFMGHGANSKRKEKKRGRRKLQKQSRANNRK